VRFTRQVRRLLTATSVLIALALTAPPGGAAAAASDLPPLPAGRLAFSTAVYDGSSHAVDGLGTMRLDGTDQRKLTDPDWPVYDHSPDWSPDGRWVVAMRQLAEPNSPTSMEIRITAADGTHSEVVGHGTYPVWSPDGRTVAWTSTDPAALGVVLLPVDITGDALVSDPSGRRVLSTPTYAQTPAWSPLSQSLAVWLPEDFEGSRSDLWLVDVSTGELRRLTSGLRRDHYMRPAWHPAGQQLAVIAQEAGSTGPAHEVWMVSADGSQQSRLMPDADVGAQEWVSWAPHGLSLAVQAHDAVLHVTPNGSVLATLGADRLWVPQTPVWSPDGTHVYVVADERGEDPFEWKPELWALSVLPDAGVRQLTTDSSVFPTTATAVDPGLALRIIGSTPAETAVAVADRLPDSSTVVLTTTASAPAATPLATTLQAPLLQVSTDGLPGPTWSALEDRGPTTAWVVGQVTDAVERQVRDLGVTTVHRVGGSDEPAVAAAVADHVKATEAFLAPTEGHVEQSAAAAAAAARGVPLLLTESGELGASARAALQDSSVTRVHLVTASSAVSTSVDEELQDLGIAVERLSGTTAADAALRLAEAFADTLSLEQPVVVPEASPGVGGPMLAASRRTALLPASGDASDPVVDFIHAHSDAISSVDLLAGPQTLTAGLETAVELAAQGRSPATEPSEPDRPTPRSVDDACPAERVPGNPFSDVLTGSTHERAISCLVWWQVAKGRTATTYAPSDGVTRDAMAAFVARTIRQAKPHSLSDNPTDAFADDNESVHHLAINQLAAAGIVGGTGDGNYNPSRPVSRGQMAKFLANAAAYVLGQPLPADRDLFADDNGNLFELDINRVAQAGLTGGRANGTYDPSGTVQRDQMGSFLARTLDLFVDNGAQLPA
jgi:hypothetical protein